MATGYHSIVPYLFLDDVAAALTWYHDKFDFTEIGRWSNDQGVIQNAEMRVGDTEIWLDGSGRREHEDDRPDWIGIWVDDVDAVHQRLLMRGVDAPDPVDREFGVRMLNVPDGMGYLWGFIRRIDTN